MTIWTPKRHSQPMSTSGGIVLWFFFWWILIPSYALYAATWLATVIVVNAAIVSYRLCRWSLVAIWRAMGIVLAWMVGIVLAQRQKGAQ